MTTTETSLGAKEIWFIGDKNSDVVKDIQDNPKVGLSYATQDAKTTSLSVVMPNCQQTKTS